MWRACEVNGCRRRIRLSTPRRRCWQHSRGDQRGANVPRASHLHPCDDKALSDRGHPRRLLRVHLAGILVLYRCPMQLPGSAADEGVRRRTKEEANAQP